MFLNFTLSLLILLAAGAGSGLVALILMYMGDVNHDNDT